jgi:hypothetical protein
MDDERTEPLDPDLVEEQDGEPLPVREAVSEIKIPGAEPVDPGYTLPIEPPATE